MLNKSFSLASVVSLSGVVLWMSVTSACSSDPDPATPTSDGGASSGADAGTSSSSSSSSTGGTSSGDPSVDSGAKDPDTVPGVAIKYGTCPTFTKCDGSLVGSFDVSGGCLSDTTFDQYKALCNGLNVHDVVIKASGTVIADATKISRETTIFLSAKVDIDKSDCKALLLFGGEGADCSTIGPILTSGAGGGPKFDVANCTAGAGKSCNCIAQATVKESSGDNYKTDGTGKLTTEGTPARTFDYCPAGSKINYKETSDSNATFGMVIEITKK